MEYWASISSVIYTNIFLLETVLGSAHIFGRASASAGKAHAIRCCFDAVTVTRLHVWEILTVSTDIYFTYLASEVLTTLPPEISTYTYFPSFDHPMAPKTPAEKREYATKQEWLKNNVPIRGFDVGLACGRGPDHKAVHVTTTYGPNFGRRWVQIVGLIAAA